MASRSRIILACLLLIFLFGVGFVWEMRRLEETSVKGVSISVSPTPTAFSSLTPSLTPTMIPTPANSPIPVRIQPTVVQKQFGGWYWRPDLNRAQRWLGTDSEGKDIWSDSGDLPTLTPTPSPTYFPQQSSSSAVSTGSRSSHGIFVESKLIQRVIEKKPK